MTKPANFDQLRELARGTPLEACLNDEGQLEALLLKEMQASQDPVTREIGAGIAGGTMSWRTVASSGVYAEYIEHGVEAMRDLDFGAVFAGLGEEATRPAPQPPGERDEDEPFSRGVLKRRR